MDTGTPVSMLGLGNNILSYIMILNGHDNCIVIFKTSYYHDRQYIVLLWKSSYYSCKIRYACMK